MGIRGTMGLPTKNAAVCTLGGHPIPDDDRARDIDNDGVGSVGMSNVLSAEKREQVVALGRLGWSLRRMEQTTGVRRETASGYLKAAGLAVRPPGGRGRLRARPANGVTIVGRV